MPGTTGTNERTGNAIPCNLAVSIAKARIPNETTARYLNRDIVREIARAVLADHPEWSSVTTNYDTYLGLQIDLGFRLELAIEQGGNVQLNDSRYGSPPTKAQTDTMQAIMAAMVEALTMAGQVALAEVMRASLSQFGSVDLTTEQVENNGVVQYANMLVLNF